MGNYNLGMSLWENRKQSALEREKAAQRLDCFLSVVYLFPNCLEVQDMDLLQQREDELSKIYRTAGRAFFFAYGVGVFGYFAFRKGTTPYFKDVLKHSFLASVEHLLQLTLPRKLQPR